MKIELNAWEIWDLLKNGSINQRDFIDCLKYREFEEFIEHLEKYYTEFDLRGYLNGGVLSVEETSEDVEDMEYVIYENGRIAITLY